LKVAGEIQAAGEISEPVAARGGDRNSNNVVEQTTQGPGTRCCQIRRNRRPAAENLLARGTAFLDGLRTDVL
jgi:hypothetical protein